MLLSLLALLQPAQASTPKIIQYYCEAPTIREVMSSDRPFLQQMIRNGGVAVLTCAPPGYDPFASVLSGRYMTADEDFLEGGVGAPEVVALNEAMSPARGDASLRRFHAKYPGAVIVALHPSEGQVVRAWGQSPLAVPTWIAISNLNGRLTSDTTRTAGVVSCLDVRPTEEALLGLPVTPGLPGHLIVVAPQTRKPRPGLPRHVGDAIQWQDSLLVLARATQATTYALPFGTIALLLVALWMIRAGGKRPMTYLRPMQAILCSIALVPVGIAIGAGKLPNTIALYTLGVVVATTLLSAAVLLVARMLGASPEDITLARLQLATGAATAYIAADVLRHGLALRLSPLSNFYLTNVRFYGIGNEYAALFLACGIVTALVTVQRASVRALTTRDLSFLGAWFLALCLVVGWPTAGANIGGMLAGLVACGAAWALAARRSAVRLPWLWPAVVAIAAVGAVLWVDTHSAHATHVGHFVGAASGSGGGLALLRTKFGMNLRLMVAPSALVIYVLSAWLALLCRGSLRPTIRGLFERWPWAMLSLPAIFAGGLFGFLVNDTGIVVLGLMAFVAIGAAFVLALEPPSLRVLHTVQSRTH